VLIKESKRIPEAFGFLYELFSVVAMLKHTFYLQKQDQLLANQAEDMFTHLKAPGPGGSEQRDIAVLRKCTVTVEALDKEQGVTTLFPWQVGPGLSSSSLNTSQVSPEISSSQSSGPSKFELEQAQKFRADHDAQEQGVVHDGDSHSSPMDCTPLTAKLNEDEPGENLDYAASCVSRVTRAKMVTPTKEDPDDDVRDQDSLDSYEDNDGKKKPTEAPLDWARRLCETADLSLQLSADKQIWYKFRSLGNWTKRIMKKDAKQITQDDKDSVTMFENRVRLGKIAEEFQTKARIRLIAVQERNGKIGELLAAKAIFDPMRQSDITWVTLEVTPKLIRNMPGP